MRKCNTKVAALAGFNPSWHNDIGGVVWEPLINICSTIGFIAFFFPGSREFITDSPLSHRPTLPYFPYNILFLIQMYAMWKNCDKVYIIFLCSNHNRI